jgi:hypothetical protein
MVQRLVDLTGQTVTITPDDIDTYETTDDLGATITQYLGATGTVTSGTTVTVDLDSLPILPDPAFMCAGSDVSDSGTVAINFPAWQTGKQNPTPADACLVGTVVIMDNSVTPNLSYGTLIGEWSGAVANGNGNCKAWPFHYFCSGAESGTEGGANPASLYVSGIGTGSTTAVVIWEVWSNAYVTDFKIVANVNTAQTHHDVPNTANSLPATIPTSKGGPTIYAVVGRTSTKNPMGAHASDLTNTKERVSASNSSITKNNMGGVMYDELTPAGATPNRQTTTNVGAYTVGMVWLLRKAYNN